MKIVQSLEINGESYSKKVTLIINGCQRIEEIIKDKRHKANELRIQNKRAEGQRKKDRVSQCVSDQTHSIYSTEKKGTVEIQQRKSFKCDSVCHAQEPTNTHMQTEQTPYVFPAFTWM